MLTFVETNLFTQLVYDYFTDEQYAALQNAIVANPGAGDVIRGSGGVRKVSVIYYLRLRQGQVWMLTMDAKNEADSIPGPLLEKIKEELDDQD